MVTVSTNFENSDSHRETLVIREWLSGKFQTRTVPGNVPASLGMSSGKNGRGFFSGTATFGNHACYPVLALGGQGSLDAWSSNGAG